MLKAKNHAKRLVTCTEVIKFTKLMTLSLFLHTMSYSLVSSNHNLTLPLLANVYTVTAYSPSTEYLKTADNNLIFTKQLQKLKKCRFATEQYSITKRPRKTNSGRRSKNVRIEELKRTVVDAYNMQKYCLLPEIKSILPM